MAGVFVNNCRPRLALTAGLSRTVTLRFFVYEVVLADALGRLRRLPTASLEEQKFACRGTNVTDWNLQSIH